MSIIESLKRQVAIGQDQGGREGMRCEDVMEQDDGEEDIRSLHEYVVGGCTQGAAETTLPCTYPMCNHAGGDLITQDAPRSP